MRLNLKVLTPVLRIFPLLDGADVDVGWRRTDKVYVDMSSTAGLMAQKDNKCPSYPTCDDWSRPAAPIKALACQSFTNRH